MAAGRGSRSGKRPKPGGHGASGAKGAARSGGARAPRTPARDVRPSAPPPPKGPFRLGAVAGTTPGKWIDIWHDRMPRTPLDLTLLEVAGQREALVSASVDARFEAS